MSTLLAIDGLRVVHDTREVLRELSLEVARGEIVALMGPSGGGKSTALRAVAALQWVDGGRITVEVNGKIAVQWNDDGATFGPVLKSGLIGLRQMAQASECSYTHFKVWAANGEKP